MRMRKSGRNKPGFHGMVPDKIQSKLLKFELSKFQVESAKKASFWLTNEKLCSPISANTPRLPFVLPQIVSRNFSVSATSTFEI